MTFILQFPTEKFAGTLKSRWIHVHQDQSECSILEEVMTKTQTIVHMEDYKSRCTKCLKNNTSFEVRIEAYRIIYRAFTKVKQILLQLLSSLHTFSSKLLIIWN